MQHDQAPEEREARRESARARDFLASRMPRWEAAARRMAALAQRGRGFAGPAAEAQWWDDLAALAAEIEALQSRGTARRLRAFCDPGAGGRAIGGGA